MTLFGTLAVPGEFGGPGEQTRSWRGSSPSCREAVGSERGVSTRAGAQ